MTLLRNDRLVDSLHGRLSLRRPQRDSLDLLARVAGPGALPLRKDQDLDAALAFVRGEAPSLTSFEREFPSLCFALATGVGKTRLMGASIAYLHLARGVRHFFVLAPNLTIYDKLVRDFTPGTPKYVFQGIAEFAVDPPEVITGDNYESGRGVRGGDLFGDRGVHVNVFNISKINSEVRGGAVPRIKRLSEYIGESYFEYLAGLPDLVLLMDESHRYRAAAGMRAINELRPVLGVELTATPFVEAGPRIEPFRNVAYSYPLARAITDGYVKEPAVATRENFVAGDYSAEQLERLKLEDGVRLHEATKVELETYARQQNLPAVKPFVLVIARDVTHAEELQRTIEGEAFFGGRYRGRVITVHSNQRGDEKEETVQRLLAVEQRDEQTEVVIHVNMLKEGWDVTNLYTIVPLRAANARQLVEQSIGRGLRLPYGRRTGVKAVDRLTIVAHDRFQEIVDEARRGDSVIRMDVVVIGRDVPDAPQQSVVVPSVVEAALAVPASPAAATPLVTTAAEARVARAVFEEIRRYEYLPRSADLREDAVRRELVTRVEQRLAAELEAAQLTLDGGAPEATLGVEATPDVAAVADRVREFFLAHTIDIPRVTVVPTGDVTTGFRNFDLDLRGVAYQPVDQAILVQALASGERALVAGSTDAAEARPEDYVVRALVDYDDISYEAHADLLYKLAGQAVHHLASYLPDADAVDGVLRAHHRTLAELIHAQMAAHYWQSAPGYEGRVSRGFTTLRPLTITATVGEPARDFRHPVDERRDIRRMRFQGFTRCLYPEQRFDSDPERRFAVLLERPDEDVLRWVKPGPGTLRIDYASGSGYDPDFVVETSDAKLLCEPKRNDEMQDAKVQAKARAAAMWCRYATEFELHHGGKPWSYLLIPDDRILDSATLAGLRAVYTVLA
ncbi:MAG TPA: DEAD/DEAH box helicase family protein [Gemmatirosa sp.]